MHVQICISIETKKFILILILFQIRHVLEYIFRYFKVDDILQNKMQSAKELAELLQYANSIPDMKPYPRPKRDYTTT